MGFKAFVEQAAFVDCVLREFNGVPSAQAAASPFPKPKVWSAKKPEILQMWRNLRPDTPIIMTPVADDPTSTADHSTYGDDGVRITGSWWFISAVLARIKDIMGYENPQHKLRLIFRGVDRSRSMRPDQQSYVFYVNLERRSRGKAGRPPTPPQKGFLQ